MYVVWGKINKRIEKSPVGVEGVDKCGLGLVKVSRWRKWMVVELDLVDFPVESFVLLTEVFDLLVFLFHIGVKFFPGAFLRLNKQTLPILQVLHMLDQGRVLFSEPGVEHIKRSYLTEKGLLVLFHELQGLLG